MKMKMVLQVSLDNDLSIKFKGRLCLCGYKMVYLNNYKETFAPTISRDSVFLTLQIIFIKDMKISLIDVKGAFLECQNSYDIYAEIPKDILPEGHPRLVVKVVNTLYGEKQAAYEWNQRLCYILCNLMGLEQLIYDKCIFVKRIENDFILILAVHVDDILIGGINDNVINLFKDEFKKHVTEIKEYPEVKKYLGFEIYHQEDGKIIMNQSNYIEKMLQDINYQKEEKRKRKYDAPINSTFNFDESDDGELFDLLPILGKLRYLADGTKFEILPLMSKLSSKGQKANNSYKDALNLLIEYVNKHKDEGICISNCNPNDKSKVVKFFAMCDSSHFNSVDGCDRIGAVFYLGPNLGSFAAFSHKSKVYSSSPMQSEIIAIDKTIRSVVIYRNILRELGFPQNEPTKIYTDSLSGIAFFNNLNPDKKMRHISRIVTGIRHFINKRIIELVYIERKHNVADMMTGIRDGEPFQLFRHYLLNGYTEEQLENFQKEHEKKLFRKHSRK